MSEWVHEMWLVSGAQGPSQVARKPRPKRSGSKAQLNLDFTISKFENISSNR